MASGQPHTITQVALDHQGRDAHDGNGQKVTPMLSGVDGFPAAREILLAGASSC
jgi:hypothetical protein